MNDVIYIKKLETTNRWHVWMGREGEEDPRPAKCDPRFFEKEDAKRYAGDWVLNSTAVGVTELS